MIGLAVMMCGMLLGVPGQIGGREPIEQGIDDATGVAQAELAFGLLGEVRREMLDVRVMIGTRDEEARRRVERGAYDAARLLAVAQGLMAREADALARRDDFWDEEPMQSRRSELLVSYLEHRVPMGVARAAVLMGQMETNKTTRATFGELAVGEVSGRLPMHEGHRAELLLLRAYGEELQGRDGSAMFVRALRLAREHAEHDPALVIECALQVALHAGEASDVARACLAVAEVSPFVDEGNEASDIAMLTLIEGMVAASERFDLEDAAAGREVLVAACELYDSLRQRPRFAGDHLAIRGAALELLAWVLVDEDVPGIVRTARARRMAEQGDVEGAIAELREIVGGAGGRWMADARWELGAVLLGQAEGSEDSVADALGLEAMGLLTALFVESPGWPDALRACRLACALAERLPSGATRESVATLEAALRVFAQDAHADGWRFALSQRTSDVGRKRELLASVSAGSEAYVLARALLVDMQHVVLQESGELERLGEARELVELFGIASEAMSSVAGSEVIDALRVRMDAQAMEAMLQLGRESEAVALARGHAGNAHAEVWLGPMSSQLRRRMVRARRERDDAQTRRMALLLVDVCRLRDSVVQVAVRDRMRRVVLGEALLESGDSRGAVALYTVLRDEIGQRADIVAGQAEAQWRLGEMEEAFSLFRMAVEAMEESGSLEEPFWHGWARMLQMLVAQNEDGARSETIRLELGRLKGMDAGFGVSPWSEYLQEMAEQFAIGDLDR